MNNSDLAPFKQLLPLCISNGRTHFTHPNVSSYKIQFRLRQMDTVSAKYSTLYLSGFDFHTFNDLLFRHSLKIGSAFLTSALNTYLLSANVFVFMYRVHITQYIYIY